MKITNKEEMQLVIDRLNELTYWYDLGKPLVSDTEYDNLYFELQEAEKTLGIVLDKSPTASISYEIKNELTKVSHNHPMLSAAKTKNETEFINYFNSKPFITMLKMDGLTCSLRYINGKLTSAETRGNGEVGEDILHNIMTLPSVPKCISYNDELIVDGEIICKYNDFESFSDDYANPRNFASGSIRLLDANECATRKLTFVAWHVVKGLQYSTASAKLDALKDLGFTVVPYSFEFKKDELVQKAKELNYPIDGLVGRFDELNYGESLGSTGHHSRAIFALKFADDEYETRLLNIEWQIGRTGVLTPVAVFEPVDTGDSVVDRASLHNISIMKSLLGEYPELYQTIYIAKMNEIIPQVVGAKTRNDIKHDHIISIPDYCPVCFKPITVKDNNGILTAWCSNDACEGKTLNKIVHYCSKNGLDIKGLSEQTISKLMDWGWVENISDLYLLNDHAEDWYKKPGFGVASVGNILYSIQANSLVSEPWRFISAIGIPLIGVNNAKELMKKFTVDEFIANAKECYDFTVLPGFGPEMNKAIQEFDYSWVEDLLDNGFVEFDIPTKEDKGSSCTGLTFVITGSVNHFKNRDEIKNELEDRGAKVSGSVSSATSYLINNDINSTSSKNKRAKELGVPIITEEEAIKMFLQ